MTTNLGRNGFRNCCGHVKNEHAKLQDSKCNKYQKHYEDFYLDKALGAIFLKPHEYSPSHPAYIKMSPEDNSKIFKGDTKSFIQYNDPITYSYTCTASDESIQPTPIVSSKCKLPPFHRSILAN